MSSSRAKGLILLADHCNETDQLLHSEARTVQQTHVVIGIQTVVWFKRTCTPR